MDYYYINQDSEDKRFKSKKEIKKLKANRGKTGRPGPDFIRKYKIFNNWFSENFLNHGNIVAHLFGVITDQMNVNGDKKAFRESSPNGRSCNKYLSRGLYFPQSIIKDHLAKYKNRTTPKNGLQLPWGYYLTGLMYIWNSKTIFSNPEHYTYYGNDNNDNPLTSYIHDPDDPAHEVRYIDRAFMPPPRYIIVGKSIRQFRQVNRMDINRVLNYLKLKYPNAIVIYVPHILFNCPKQRNETGNKKHSMNAMRLFEIIWGIEHGWYKNLKRIIV